MCVGVKVVPILAFCSKDWAFSKLDLEHKSGDWAFSKLDLEGKLGD
jgi:hypothetical protein